jgi:hypothetical protein
MSAGVGSVLLGVAAAALALGCGSRDSASAPSSSTAPNPGGPASDAPGGSDATAPSGDTDAQSFMPSATDDGGGVTQSGPCTPGIYQGQFMTYVGAGDDGGAPGLFSFMWNGSLTIDLAAQKVTMTSMTGGEIPTSNSSTTLAISDGGALDGSDPYGSFFADLSGGLDCAPDAGPPYRLTATLSNGSYKESIFSLSIIGHLSADYQEGSAGAPPMFVNGQILIAGIFTDGGTPTSSASGTWTATYVSPP